VRAIFEGKVDCLNIIPPAECVFCKVRHKAEDKFDYLNRIVIYEVRAKVEGKVEDLNIKFEADCVFCEV